MATRYVSNTATNGYAVGADSGTALTKGAPWLTLVYAATAASTGDTIVVNGGTYDEIDDIDSNITLIWRADDGMVEVTQATSPASKHGIQLNNAAANYTFSGGIWYLNLRGMATSGFSGVFINTSASFNTDCDLFIIRAGSTGTTNYGIAFDSSYTGTCNIKRLRIIGCGSHGIRFRPGACNVTIDCLEAFLNGGANIVMESGTGGTLTIGSMLTGASLGETCIRNTGHTGGTITINNLIGLSTNAGGAGKECVRGDVTVNNSFIFPNWWGYNSGAALIDGIDGTVTNGGGIVGLAADGDVKRKAFNTGFRSQGSICLMMDDWTNVDSGDFGLLVAAANARGLVVNCAVEMWVGGTPAGINGVIDELKGYVLQGHGISAHGAAGFNAVTSTNFDPLNIVGASGTATKANGVLSTSLGHSYTLSEYENFTQLDAAMTADGYTVTIGSNSSVYPLALDDFTAQDITGAGYDAAITRTVALQYEFEHAFARAEEAFGPGTVSTHVWVQGAVDDEAATACKNAGFAGARGANQTNDAAPVTLSRLGEVGIRPYAIAGFKARSLVTNDIVGDPTATRALTVMSSICEYVKLTGAHIVIFDHDLAYDTTNESIELNDWIDIMDAIVEQGMETVTFGEQVRRIKEDEIALQTRTIDGTGYDLYTYDYADDTADSPVPVAGSPLIATGTRWWTGPNPVGMDGEPFSDFDTDIGTVQSTLGDFHPKNL